MGFPTTGLLDDFNRADANPLNGSWTNGYFGEGNLRALSNQVKSAAAGWCGARYNGASFGADCEVFITLATKGEVCISLRLAGTLTAPNGYYLDYGGGTNLFMGYIVTGTSHQLGLAIPVTVAAGDKIGFSAHGSTLSAWLYHSAWSLIDTRIDTHYADGGLLALEMNGTTPIIDDFSGGSEVSGLAIPVLMNQYRQRRN